MATTKTLTPTNQAITLAAFTEKPDNRTNVTNDDKLADAVNTLNSKITLSSITQLANSSIAVSGDSSWHSTGDMQLAEDYKKYFIKCGVHGAAYSSAIIDADAIMLIGFGQPFILSAYWDADDLGQIRIYGRTVSVTAKSKNLAFDYNVYGLK